MQGRLDGKVALITGAGAGIGRGIATKFAREDAFVVVLDVNPSAVDETVQQIQNNGGQAVAVYCNLRNPDKVQQAIQTILKSTQKIDIVVNNAAIMPSGVLHETSLDDWDAIFEVNVRGAYLVNQAVIPTMLAHGQGSIIHMASVTGILGLPGIAAYSATKGALISLTRAMSTDYAAHGIRVNAVSPGTIDSPMLHNFLAEQKSPEKLRKEFDAMHPIGRVGTIEEVANVCVFLASDDASFVTGSNYEVDGGLSSKGEQPQD